MKAPEQGGPGLSGPTMDEDPALLRRKSVLMGLAASMGFVFASAARPSVAIAGGTVKPIAATQGLYAPKWTPSTVYVLGQQVISPTNDVVSANTAHTSSAAYATDRAKWTLSITFASKATETAVTSGRLSERSLAASYGRPANAPEPSGGDDRAAIQAVIDTVPAGGTVLLQHGLYLLSLAPHPVTAGYSCALTLPSGVRLVGAGKAGTTLRLLANQHIGIDTQGVSIIYNRTLTGGDEDVEIHDLTVDGNGANQTKLHNGITFIRTRCAKCTRVRVMNVKGTANFPPNETFHFDTQLGIDTTFTDCEAVGSAGTQGSGFSANSATSVHYAGCTARGMSSGMGFTNWQSQSVTHSGCRAWLNGSNGFNTEESCDVSYSACHAGGVTAVGSDYPYAAGASLGNTGPGFCINGTRNALISSSSSRRNGTGLTLVEGANGASGRVTASAFTENNLGVSAATAATLQRWFFDPTNAVSGNTTAQWDFPASLGGWQSGPGNIVGDVGPTLPPSGVALANPYPWRVSVYIVGGVTRLRVNEADIDIGTRHLVLDPGMTIKLWYSTVPGWLWLAL